MNYPLYLILGISPSIIWLLFYLRKDCHPESNRMILKIFFFGMLATIPAALIELGFYDLISGLNQSFIAFLIYLFVGIALTEEVLKYLVVKWQVLKNPEFDEPIDLMLYMIIAALGFAAVENILYLLHFGILEAFWVSALRFVGAIFLHALVSGTLGFFLALSFFNPKQRLRNAAIGFLAAISLHGIFNYSIIKMGENQGFVFLTIAVLIGLAFFVSFGFRKLKKMKSICKIVK